MSYSPCQPHSVRLFPKNKGATAYNISGIASLCDWVLLSDWKAPITEIREVNATKNPRYIFISLRNPVAALHHFYLDVLPRLNSPFVLLSGSEDITLPNQTDKRWPPFDKRTCDMIHSIAASPKLIHWFAENLDCKLSDRVSPLPTGMVYPDGNIPTNLECPSVPKLASRPLRVLSGSRARKGEQWEPRKLTALLSQSNWSEFTTHLEEEVPERQYLDLISEHSFVLCVEGGGFDPSPKAWQAIQYGAIPIMRKTPCWEAYREMPCVAIDAWEPEAISQKKLLEWKSIFLADFDDERNRAAALEKLNIGFWWQKIVAAWEQQ